MLNENFAILGALILFFGQAHYALEAYKGRSKPNRVSWLLWAAAPLVAFSAQMAEHASLQVTFLSLALGLSCFSVVLASLANREAYWKIEKLDLMCGAVSVLALILWFVTGKGNVAIALSIVADLFASVPTLVKANSDSQSEFGVTYLAAFVGAGLTLLAIKQWTFANYGFALYELAIDALLVAVIVKGWRMDTLVKSNIPDEPESNLPQR